MNYSRLHEFNFSSYLLAHGEGHRRSRSTDNSKKINNSGSAAMDPHKSSTRENNSNGSPTQSFTEEAVDETTIADSLGGHPFAIGELTLGLILVGPICLSVLRRRMQS